MNSQCIVKCIVGDSVEKTGAEPAPLSTFVCGQTGGEKSQAMPTMPEEEESFQVRSEQEDDSDIEEEAESEEEEEMSDMSGSDEEHEEEEEEEGDVEEESLNENKENREEVTTARASRPRRESRKKVNYTFDDDSEDEMAIIDLVSGEYHGETEGEEEDQNMGSDTNIDTVSSGGSLIVEAKGGLSAVESILHHRRAAGKKEMRVKFVGNSYRRTAWVDREDLVAVGKQSLVRGYDKRVEQGRIDPFGDLEEGVHPDWCVVERILASRQSGDSTEYLVKWCGLNYSDSTWESSDALSSDEDKQALRKYEELKCKEQAKLARSKDKNQSSPEIDVTKVPTFCNGRKLRDYQQDSLKWMIQNWYSGKNCILGDEMGLGKTAQSISCIEYQRQFGNATDPFLIIAPLTTLGHWKREIETWTDMNCVLYCGTANDKKIIQTYEIWCEGGDNVVKPDVILSSYEQVMRDAGFFQSIEWETMIIDEAHRMKGTKGATRTCIAGIPCQWILLLTGTPVQNNVKELFGLLNLLDPDQYDDEEEFLDRFGRSTDKMTPTQVRDIQHALRPILLRRMKEDVETLPEKEECIIWVQLTRDQKAYYKAIFENQIGALLGGAAQKNLPVLRNVAMELRKVCCHPFLCEGVEDDMIARKTKEGKSVEELDLLVSSCGKMQLIHKLLPKLRAEKRKVLIFSQFKIMLNVLEDYCNLMDYPVERIDGDTSSRERQGSIDRFSSTDKDGFIFLLSTKAGGQGITLTAADTCILYDSDWNPQNDLQAMARCHRIGQTKDVTIYRLVSKDTYEENLFRASSKKYGLDEAILGDLGVNEGGAENLENDGKRISDLLKHGAHCLKDSDHADQEMDAFLSENIDVILNSRTEKRQIGGRAGNTFSVAKFGEDVDASKKDDKEFWQSVLPDACKSFERSKTAPEILPPRKKRSINYSEKNLKRKIGADDFEYDFRDEDLSGDYEPEEKATKNVKKVKAPKSRVKKWVFADLNTMLELLLRFGMNLDRFKSAQGNLSYFISKGYAENTIMEVALILKESLMEIVSIVPKRMRNSGYIVRNDASPEHLERSDRMYLESLAKYEEDVENLTDEYVSTDLPLKVARICSSPEESGFNYDRKLFSRIAKFAHSMVLHIDFIECIEKRLITSGTQMPLPKVSVKNVPEFWWRTKENDENLLKAIYYNGWDWTMRSSSKQLEEIESILQTGENFSSIRTVYLGTETAPPEEEDYITKEQWSAEPRVGYKKMAKVLNGRIKLLSDNLLRWKKFSQIASMRSTPMKPVHTESADIAKNPKEHFKTPMQDNTALDVLNKGSFTGPAPSVEPLSNNKVASRQRSILDTFRIEPKQKVSEIAVDIDLTIE